MKKFTALFLIFSLMMLPTSLYAKKRGAKLIVIKKDGQQIKGELIAVKPNSLLLLDTEGKDVSVGIADIKVIRILKKSKAGIGAGIGFVIVGGFFAAIFIIVRGELEITTLGAIGKGALLGSAGALTGGLIGEAVGKDKTIRIDVKSDSEIQKTMDKLRKKARIRDYK